MLLGEINRGLKPYKPKIFLAKPDRTIIGKLNEAYDIKTKINFGAINEIEFKLPYFLEINHKTTKNEHIDLIMGHYLLKVDTEWYIISQPKKSGKDSKEILEVKAFSLGYELRNKRIAIYRSNYDIATEQPLPVNADIVLNDTLEGTGWTKGYVDAEFNLVYRSFDISEKTVLDFLQDIAGTFDGVLIYNTEEKTINLYKLENLGVDKGFVIKYGKYLNSINQEPNFDEVCTRLYSYGKDGMTFNDVNPTGQAFVDDYSYYMFPYDETITDITNDVYIVNSSSKYMSDELCHGILKSKRTLEEKTPIYETLLNNIALLQLDLDPLMNQLATLEDELAQIEDSLDMANKTSAMNWDTNLIEYPEDNRQTLITQRDNKQADIDIKKLEIQAKQTQIDGKFVEIDLLYQELSPENFYTQATLDELKRFTIEKKWSDENIFQSKDLYERTLIELKKVSQPMISYKIDIVDFLKVIECQHDWDKLNIGDIVTIKYNTLGISIQAKIIQITHDHEKNKISLTIANAKDIKDGFYTIKDLVKNVNSATTALDLSKFKWEQGGKAKGTVEQLIDDLMDRNKQKVLSGTNENYTLDRTGMTFKDPNDPLNYLRILHNVIAFTNDGGNTFKTAISPDGIVGEYIYGKIITGVHLLIGDVDGTMEIRGNQGLVTDWLDRIVMRWGLYSGGDTVGFHDDDKFGLELVRYEGDTTNKLNTITLDAEEGFFIQKIMQKGIHAGEYRNTAWLDVNGNFWLEEITARRMTIMNGNNEPIIEVGVDVSDTRLNVEKFNEILTDGVLSPLEKYQVRAEWERIQAEYIKLQMQSSKYDLMEREDEVGVHHTQTQWNAYDLAYQSLKLYIEPFFVDMEINSPVVRTTFESQFKTYYDTMKDLVHAIEDAIKLSSVQLGHNYNNVVIDAISGVVVTRDDGLIKTVLNATEGIYIENEGDKVFYADLEGNLRLRGNLINETRNGTVQIKIDLDEGFSISKNGEKTFWVDIDGNLFSRDMTADRLILRDDDGDVIIDANSGFLNLNKFNQIAGTLQAENIVSRTFKADVGFIADLTVNHLTTIDNDNVGSRNYIDISGNRAKWITGNRTGGTSQATDLYGNLLWWTDSDHNSTTTIESEGYGRVMQDDYDEITKLLISFDQTDPDAVPYMLFGGGDGNESSLENKGQIKKSDSIFDFLIWGGGLPKGMRAKYYGVDIVTHDFKAVKITTALDEGLHNNSNARIVATRIIGTGSFKSPVTHNIGSTEYVVHVIPTSSPNGYLGEWWVTKGATSFTVNNTGSATTSFDYVILC